MHYVCGIALSLLLASSSAIAQEPTNRDRLAAIENQLSKTAATAGPSIVCVVTSRSELYPKPPSTGDRPGKLGGFDRKEFLKGKPSAERIELANSLDLSDPVFIPNHGYGGGVVIDSSGLVLTPYHLIDGATKIYVFLPGGVGSYADIHAADSRSDLAVLKLISPPKKLVPIKFADVRTRDVNGKKANVFIGKLVIQMALPYTSSFRMDKPDTALGSITNVRYRLINPKGTDTALEKQASYYRQGPLLEHDIRLNAGMTGAALLNLDGEMIGLTTVAAVVYNNREIGPGYAIPADDNFHRIVDVLRKGEEVEYGFLGVTLPEDRTGVTIGPVTPQGPADLAGLASGDVITKINGHPAQSYDDLLLYVGSALAGSKVKLTISRMGETQDVVVTLAKFANSRPYIASVRPDPVFGLRVDYSSTHSRTQSIGIQPGVSIREIIPDTPAEAKFKAIDPARDWVITKVNGKVISNPAEFYAAAKGQTQVKLTLKDPAEPSRLRELTLP